MFVNNLSATWNNLICETNATWKHAIRRKGKYGKKTTTSKLQQSKKMLDEKSDA